MPEKPRYLTTPPATTGMPRGIPYIVGNEAAERFSYYGMRAILYVFMTEHLLNSAGVLEPMDQATATAWQHRFVAATYIFPIIGAVLSDWLWGKYKTILWISLMYCLGHATLATVDFPTQTGIPPKAALLAAMVMLSVGAGGIKPCVSAHVGDQFGRDNQHLMSKVYQWFYFAINVGAAASMILTPWLLDNLGPGVAFGVPGVLMAIATYVFWLGRNKFVHVPPTGNRIFAEIVSRDSLRALVNLLPLFALVSMFWALFDQTQSSWVEQAKHMDRLVLGMDFNPSQIQAVNSILVLVLVPVFAVVIYPFLGKFFEVTPLRKVGVGLFVGAASFVICAFIQRWIDAGHTPHIAWQLLAYLVITAAEVMVSITALEFSYSQAPKTLKSFIMGVYLSSIALGNLVISEVNARIEAVESAGYSFLSGENYYWSFAGATLLAACVYVVWSQFYRGRTFIQGED